MDFISTIILGIIEGITEFLPISTNAHLLVAESLLNFPATKDLRNTFAIALQLGAILAVVVYYFPDLLRKVIEIPSSPSVRRFWLNLIIAFLPIGIIGLVFGKRIQDSVFGANGIIALMLILGGIAFLLIESRGHQGDTHQMENITTRQALLVGSVQILSIVPGVSRSGASIIGGLLAGLDRPTAARFSFYLAIPTIGSAVGYQLFNAIKDKQITSDILPLLVAGMVAGFITALITIRWLLGYISRHDFRVFGVYRIIAGIIVLVLVLAKVLGS